MTRPDSPDFPDTSHLALTAEIVPAPAPLAPIVDEVLALLERLPMERRLHACFDGSWSAVEVITSSAHDPMRGDATEWLEHLPALLALFAAFGGVIPHCTIARIAPGDLLDWHYDPTSLDHDLSRLHLPVQSNPDAVTDFCDTRVHWPKGRLFYGDYGFPHRVTNTGSAERIHIYFDVPSALLRPLLPDSFRDRHQIRETAVNAWLMWKASSAA
jgi:hypothetical protein